MNDRHQTEEPSRASDATEDRIPWLASCPEQNPNPIVELDLQSGVLHYLNPAAARMCSLSWPPLV